MINQNPGCILACYLTPTMQRHRLVGQNLTAFGLRAPNARLMPFQCKGETGTATVTSFKLVNAVAQSNGVPIEITLNTTLLEVTQRTGGGWWVTWKAQEDLNIIPDAGLWYPVVVVNSVSYYFEVLHLREVNSSDVAGIQLISCALEDGAIQIELSEDDTLSTTTTSESIEYYNGTDWIFAGSTDAGFLWNAAAGGPILIRRTVVLNGGRTLTASGEITYTDSLAPCEDLAVNIYSTGTIAPGEKWRLRFAPSMDHGTVLYQTGFEQWIYFNDPPVFLPPEITVEDDPVTDGFGQEVVNVATVKNDGRFEFGNIPDYATPALVMLGYLEDTAYLEEFQSGLSLPIERVRIAARRQDVQTNAITVTFTESETVVRCEDNFTIE